MQKILVNIDRYLKSKYQIDVYEATDEQLLEAGRNGNVYLPRTSRATSTLTRRWKTSLWKKAQYFASCNPDDLYTLLVELKTEKLYSQKTEALAAAIAEQLPGKWFYWVEAGKKNGVHMHVILHSQKAPLSRVKVGSRYYRLNPWRLKYEQYDSPLEAVVRTVTYGAKLKNGGYRGDGATWEATWVSEVHEALDCERTKVTLSKANISTRGITTISPKLEEMWLFIREDRHRKWMERLGYEVCV